MLGCNYDMIRFFAFANRASRIQVDLYKWRS